MAAAIVLAALVFLALPRLAAERVAHAIGMQGAQDQAAYAAGQSSWHWRLRGADDLVAGRVFGPGMLVPRGDGGLDILMKTTASVQVGLPLARVADVGRLTVLHLDMRSDMPGRFVVWVRPTLTAPLAQAPLDDGQPSGPRSFRLDRLSWTDETGRPVPAPTRAAMLRLEASLPVAARWTLREAGLAAPASLPIRHVPLPAAATAEGLLRWRDRQRSNDPLVILGAGDAPAAPAPWSWALPALYLLLCAVAMGAIAPRLPPRAADLLHASLAVAGPLALIAGMQLGPRPAWPALAMFLIGVGYAAILAIRRAIPSWRWQGAWTMAGWPLLAVPVAVALAAVAGHAPTWPPMGRIAVYVAWALFQQWLMLAVVGGLLARSLPRPLAVVVTATLFALLHTPNGFLMQLCFVAELGWGWWYLHHRTLVPVAVAHAASAVVLQAALVGGVLRSLEVSARFLM